MVNIYVDGSFQPETKEGSYGMVIRRNGKRHEIGGKLGKVKDNNIAEYGALIKGLEEIKKRGLSREWINLYSDSEVIIRQLRQHLPPPKKKEHCKWYRETFNLFQSFSKCFIDYIYHKKNPAHRVARAVLK